MADSPAGGSASPGRRPGDEPSGPAGLRAAGKALSGMLAAGRGRFPAGWRSRRLALRRAVAAAIARDRDRWPFLIPIGFGTGIVCYFAWSREPAPWLGLAVALAGLALAWGGRRRGAVLAAGLVIAAMGLGHGIADWRTGLQVGPVLAAPSGIVDLTGRVVAVERLPDGRPRVTLAPSPALVADIDAVGVPKRVRVRLLPDRSPPRVGTWVALRAGLLPPRGPVLPGGFDFRRHLAFKGIGAVGFAVGPWGPAEPPADAAAPSAWIDPGRALIAHSAVRLAGLRQAIAARVTAAIADPAAAAVAVALLTGDRAAIPERVAQDLRDAGIAHLLAISGLHVGLVAGLVFVTLRLIGAAIPRVALTWPVKKLAALAALGAAIGYMLLVGAPVPTQRAVMMGGLVLLAVLVDRRALTLRLVALAAMAVMTMAPASVTGPSFQMSFAAVLALVAGWQAIAPRLAPDRDRTRGWGDRIGGYALGLVGTSIIASAATGLFALYHFQRIAVAGVVANLWAVPLTAFAIMPAGMIGLLLIPVGLEAPVFAAMGWAIGLLLDSAAWVAGWRGAALSVPMMPAWGLIVGVIGFLWLLLTQAWWRWLGLVGLLLAAMSPATTARPVLVAEADARVMAIVAAADPAGTVGDRDGRALHPSMAGTARFVQAQWARATALPIGAAWQSLARTPTGGGVACDPRGCVLSRAGAVLAMPTDPAALREDCARADILVTLLSVPPEICRGVRVIDRATIRAAEGGALYRVADRSRGAAAWRWVPVRDPDRLRPWHPGFGGPA